MDSQVLKNINQILVKDSKVTTYKFALLRAVIEVIQEDTPYRRAEGGRVVLPVGTLVAKWLEYYYPVIEAELPQINGDTAKGTKLKFEESLKSLTSYYSQRGGLSAFYVDFIKGNLPAEVEELARQLCKQIYDAIITGPMKHTGFSVYGEHYSIFKKVSGLKKMTKNRLDAQTLVDRFGEFSIPLAWYEVFQYMGSFIAGTDTILVQWAEFTVQRSNNRLNRHQVLDTLLKSPEKERKERKSREIFKNLLAVEGKLACVWSGKPVEADMHIDHLIPFAVWKNNDLWNLMPAKAAINSKKSDKIPSSTLLHRRKQQIVAYWQLLENAEPDLFMREVNIHLSDLRDRAREQWAEAAFHALVDKCRYLTETRGFETWNY